MNKKILLTDAAPNAPLLIEFLLKSLPCKSFTCSLLAANAPNIIIAGNHIRSNKANKIVHGIILHRRTFGILHRFIKNDKTVKSKPTQANTSSGIHTDVS